MKTKVAKDAKATKKGTDVQMKATMAISHADFFKTTISLSRMPRTWRQFYYRYKFSAIFGEKI
jgi:hypothetical protein